MHEGDTGFFWITQAGESAEASGDLFFGGCYGKDESESSRNEGV